MKMKKMWLLCLGAALFFSCHEEKKMGVPEENLMLSTPEEVKDLVGETLDLSTYVFPANYSEVSACLLNRLKNRAAVLDGRVKAVVLHNSNLPGLQAKDYAELLNIYANNGSILVVEPTLPVWNAFMQKLMSAVDELGTDYPSGLYEKMYSLIYAEDQFRPEGEDRAIYVSDGEETDPDEHFYDMIGLRDNDVYYVLDIHDEDEVTEVAALMRDQDGNESESKAEEQTIPEGDMTEYRYGLVADHVVQWLDTDLQTAPWSKSPVLLRNGADDMEELASAQTFTYCVTVRSQQIEGLTRRSVSGTVTYQVWAFCDLKKLEDYYLVHECISMNNAELQCEIEDDSKWVRVEKFAGRKGQKFYGPYMSCIKTEPVLEIPQGASGSVSLMNVQPTTTIGSSSHTVDLGWNFSGDVGFNTIGVSGGVNFSESWTTNTSDLTVTENNVGTNPQWSYNAPDPFIYPKGFHFYHYPAKLIQKNTCTVNNAWIWKVSNPKGSFKLKSNMKYASRYLDLDDYSVVGYCYYPGWEYRYHRTFSITPPPRYRADYMLTCHTLEGDKEIEDYLMKHYPDYWKNEVPIYSVTEGDVNPVTAYVNELLCVIVGDAARWKKDGKQGKYRIEIRKKASTEIVYQFEFTI